MADDEERVRVLVTGGAGFIGGHLADLLLEAGHEVGVMDLLVPQVHPTGKWPEWFPTARVYGSRDDCVGDIRNERAVVDVLDEFAPQVVVNLAALVGVGQAESRIMEYVETNTLGTAIVLEAILEHNASKGDVRRFIQAGSMSAYGEGAYLCPMHGSVRPTRTAMSLVAGQFQPRCPFESSPNGCATPDQLQPYGIAEWQSQRPNGIYAQTKRDAEELALNVARSRGLSVAVPRFFNVVGPRQQIANPYTGIAAIFTGRCLAGLPPIVYEDGHQARDLVDVRDVAAALLALVGDPNPRLARRTWASQAHQGTFNVGTGKRTTVLQLAEAACRILAPQLTPIVTGQVRAGDIRACLADPTRARKQLGWEPKYDTTSEAYLVEMFQSLAVQTAPTQARAEQAHEELMAGGLLHLGGAPEPESTGPHWSGA